MTGIQLADFMAIQGARMTGSSNDRVSIGNKWCLTIQNAASAMKKQGFKQQNEEFTIS